MQSIINNIEADRKKLEGKALTSTHNLTILEFQSVQAYLFEKFDSMQITYNNLKSTEELEVEAEQFPVCVVIGF